MVSTFNSRESGGAMRDRTADLLRARQALSQLSYSPITAVKNIKSEDIIQINLI